MPTVLNNIVMTYQIGDIVRISLDPNLPEPNRELPGDGWDAIVVDVLPDGDNIEIAWLSQSVTPKNPRLSPMRETWDSSTVVIEPKYDAHVTLLRRATYTNAADADKYKAALEAVLKVSTGDECGPGIESWVEVTRIVTEALGCE